MKSVVLRLCAVVVVMAGVLVNGAEGKAQSYKQGDSVPVLANKVGPFANPSETYPFYSLPFCRPSSMKSKSQELGEALSGNRKFSTPYDIKYLVDSRSQTLCSKTLTFDEVSRFAEACHEDFFFEMSLDGLPIWGFLGETEQEDILLGHTANSKHYLFTYLYFSIAYNGPNIITVNVSTDASRRLDITNPPPEGLDVEFTYSVKWVPTTASHAHRMERYSQSKFLPSTLEIHWLSIINSLVLVILLTAFLAIILLRVVKNDFTRYMRAADDEEEQNVEEESGWKLLHGDVFRVPPHASALSAIVGSGAHMFLMMMTLLVMTVAGFVNTTRRGALLTAFIVLYALTASFGGYTSARLYKQLNGKAWVWNIVATAAMFPGPFACCFMFLNTVAWVHGSTSAIPFGTIAVVLALYFLVTVPLTVLGGIAGHNSQAPQAPCRTHKVPRQIPASSAYGSRTVKAVIAGFLPFSAISVELHYFFASIWGHKVYTLFGILLVAFLLLIVVTSFINIAMTYFQLADEDYRWWWQSLASGGMVGAFIFSYAAFYYSHHSGMSGFLQTSFYFGYMSMVSYAAFLALGFVGFTSSHAFVNYIYSSIKIE